MEGDPCSVKRQPVHHCQPINIPPSTDSTWPVIRAALSEEKNATAAATSSVVTGRPSGVSTIIRA
jgi:hypothetical protein